MKYVSGDAVNQDGSSKEATETSPAEVKVEMIDEDKADGSSLHAADGSSNLEHTEIGTDEVSNEDKQGAIISEANVEKGSHEEPAEASLVSDSASGDLPSPSPGSSTAAHPYPDTERLPSIAITGMRRSSMNGIYKYLMCNTMIISSKKAALCPFVLR